MPPARPSMLSLFFADETFFVNCFFHIIKGLRGNPAVASGQSAGGIDGQTRPLPTKVPVQDWINWDRLERAASVLLSTYNIYSVLLTDWFYIFWTCLLQNKTLLVAYLIILQILRWYPCRLFMNYKIYVKLPKQMPIFSIHIFKLETCGYTSHLLLALPFKITL